MISIILVRSGCTEYEADGRLEGNLDIPLDETGILAAGRTAEQLNGTQVTALYCGSSQACRETATPLAEALGRKAQTARAFDELCLGLWQGLLESDVQKRHPKAFRQWKDEPDVICPPKGETFRAGLARAVGHLARATRKMEGATIVVVLPRLMYGVVKCHLLGETPARAWEYACKSDSPQWERFETDERTFVQGQEG